MNKVILMGRLTKEVDLKYSQGATPVAVAKYSLAVKKQFKKDGEPEADFLNIVSFGKAAEFASKYFKKGQLVVVVGRITTRSYDKDGVKHHVTEIIAEEQHFAESKKEGGASAASENGLPPLEEEDDLPF